MASRLLFGDIGGGGDKRKSIGEPVVIRQRTIASGDVEVKDLDGGLGGFGNAS